MVFDKIKKSLYNKDRKWEPQKCVLPYIFMINTTKLGRAYVVLLLFAQNYYYYNNQGKCYNSHSY